MTLCPIDISHFTLFRCIEVFRFVLKLLRLHWTEYETTFNSVMIIVHTAAAMHSTATAPKPAYERLKVKFLICSLLFHNSPPLCSLLFSVYSFVLKNFFVHGKVHSERDRTNGNVDCDRRKMNFFG